MPIAKEKKSLGYPDQQWSELIRQMAGGDQSSLAEFYDQSSRLVFGLVARIVNDRGAAEEITLDTYHQVWRQAHNFDPERGKPSSWILTIARNRAIDRLRSSSQTRRRQTPIEEMTPLLAADDSPEEATTMGERRRLVRAALAALKPEQRELIEIAYFA
jgi:RNA polymerase sigma-70 factor (ECF subfamily)